MANNPQVAQGTLNKVRASVVVPSYTNLNIDSSHMAKKFVTTTPDGDSVMQPETATGIVNSPEPYVMYTITVGILRSQALAASWQSQMETQSSIGRVIVHPDSAAFPSLTFYNCSILRIDPGPFDGSDPTVDVQLRGVYQTNSDLWNFT